MEHLLNPITLLSNGFFPNLGFLLSSLVVLVSIYGIYIYCIFPQFSPLKDLPGPSRDSWWLGNLKKVGTRDIKVYTDLVEEYGLVVKFNGAFGREYILLTDPAAVNYVLGEFTRPVGVAEEFEMALGPSLLACEGDNHRRQRRIQLPAFSPPSIRGAFPAFLECSNNLRDKFNEMVSAETFTPNCWKNEAAGKLYLNGRPAGSEKEAVLDLNYWGNKFAIDAVGKAGFDLDINAVLQGDSALYLASHACRTSEGPIGSTYMQEKLAANIRYLLVKFPLLKKVPIISRELAMFDPLFTESLKYVAKRKEEIRGDGLETLLEAKDISSTLFRANMIESKNKLSDVELLAQLPTFILTGGETTAASFCWTIHCLSKNREVQGRLRKELREARTNAQVDSCRSELSYEELESLPYLNAVVCESFRLNPVITESFRVAPKAHLIPLSKPIISKKTGKVLDHIQVHKNQFITIPTSAMNRNKEIFGEDAHEFNPERWQRSNLGAGVGSSHHLMTFSAGKRSCPAHKFATLELKVVIAVIIDEFEFFPRNENFAVEQHTSVTVNQPFVVGELELGGRLPIKMRKAARSA